VRVGDLLPARLEQRPRLGHAIEHSKGQGRSAEAQKRGAQKRMG
jgi:hypothetical protein